MQVLYYDDEKLELMKPKHLESLVKLVRNVWDKQATIESYLSERSSHFHQNPFMKKNGFPIVLLIENDKVVGQCNSIPCKMCVKNKEYTIFWNAGLHLLPEFRGKKLGILLPEELTRRLPIVTGFFVIPQQLKTHQKLGFSIVGKIPDFIKIYNPFIFLDKIDAQKIDQFPLLLKKILNKKNKIIRVPILRIGAAFIWIIQHFKKIKKNQLDQNLTFSFVKEFDISVDLLWKKNCNYIQFSQVRNSSYMNWKFKSSQGWKKIIIKEKDNIVGFAIVAVRRNSKQDKLAGLKIVSTIDFVWDFEKKYIIDHYFVFINNYAIKNDADISFCSINHKLAQERLKALGYFKIPGSVYFVVRSQRKDVKPSSRMEDWFLTRGDADAAGSMGPNLS